MKKHFTLTTLFALMMFLSFTLIGCSTKTTEINAPEVLQSLLTKVDFETELAPVENNVFLYFPDLPEHTSINFYNGGGYIADQTALFTFSDASECKRAITSIQTYVKDLSQQYSSYAPEEAAKIERAVIQQHGPHLFLCITNDYESAANILNKLG